MSEDLKGKNIAIVGGGFTGLTAAYKLTQLGAKVTIFEAGTSVGGLASGCTIQGDALEKAYHFLYKTDKHMIRLLKELNLENKLNFYKSSVSTFVNEKLYPMSNPTDLLKFSPLKFHNRVRLGLVVLYLQRVKNWQKLTEVSAIDWLNKYAGKEATKIVWEPLLKGKFDKYYKEITMCWLWGRIKQRADSRDNKMGGEVLGYIDGGFEIIINKLLEKIREGNLGSIVLNTVIKKVRRDKASQKVEVITKDNTSNFDKVLLTVPNHIAYQILKDYKEEYPIYFEKLLKVDYLDAAVLLFATDTPITKFYWHNINTVDSPFVVFLSLTSLIGNDRFNGKHVYYIGDYIPPEHQYMKISEEDLINLWFKSLKNIFPNFSFDSVIEKKLFRFKNAQHIVDIGFDKKIVSHKTPCKGVFLSNFSQIFPMDRGTNYAVRDGYKMAEKLSKRSDE